MKKAIIVLVGFIALAIISAPQCYASGGQATEQDTGCSGGSRSGNACNKNGLTWIYYRIDKDKAPKSNGVIKFVFPNSSWRTEHTQGKSTVVGCDKGFWMLGYDIIQTNEKKKDTMYEKDGFLINGLEYGLGQDLANYGTTNSDWHRAILNRVEAGDLDNKEHAALIFNEEANKPCTGNKSVDGEKKENCNGGLYKDPKFNNNIYHFSSYISDGIKSGDGAYPTFGKVQWRYTKEGAHGQAGSRSMTYVDGHSDANVDTIDASLIGFELGYNYKKFAEAQISGTTEDVKSNFNDVWTSLTYYDANGNKREFKHKDGVTRDYPETIDEAFNDIAYFCYERGTPIDYTAKFSGETQVKYTGSNSWHTGANNTIEITSGSYEVNFSHTIKRTDSKDEGKVTNRHKIKSKTQSTEFKLEKGKSITVTEKETGTLAYGESKKICSYIKFYGSILVHDGKEVYDTDELVTTPQACVTITRPAPNVDPYMVLNVWNGSDKSTADKLVNAHKITAAGNHGDVKITSNDGSFYVNVDRYISRENDGAGGEITVNWSGTNNPIRGGANPSDTKKISEGGTEKLLGNGWSYRLKYGESYRICATMTISYTGAGNSTTTKTIGSYCVTLKRDMATCSLDRVYYYGVNSGNNYARVGAINYTKNGLTGSQSDDKYSWTAVGTGATTNPVYSAAVFAKPGDQIGFRHEMCAGAFYPIAVNRYTKKQVGDGTNSNPYRYDWSIVSGSAAKNFSYKITGKMSTQESSDNSTITEYGLSVGGNYGYLFGDSILKRDSGKYEKEWSANFESTSTAASSTSSFWYIGGKRSGNVGGGWSRNNSNIFLTYNETTDVYNVNKTYNSPSAYYTDYNCSVSGSATSSSVAGYQIAGKNCTLGRTDVGGVLSQNVSYQPVIYVRTNSGVSITNGSNGSEADQRNFDRKRSLTARVKVPYNYLIKPYAKNSSKVVYIGETMTVTPGVYVQPRVNTGVTGSANATAYATITKPTTRTYRIYKVRDGIESTLSTSPATTNTYNQSGDLNGGSSDDTAIEVKLIDKSEYDYQVGDQICVEVSYYPADSHDWPERGIQDIITNNNTNPAGRQASQSQPFYQKDTAMYRTSMLSQDQGTVRATACSTIAKRPTMSVESSNAYSATKFSTSMYGKKFTDSGSEYLFGSWSEYGVFGQVSTANTFASGAALGYRTNARATKVVNATRDNDYSTAVASSSSLTESARQCVFTVQTFVNVDSDGNCASSSEKISGISAMDFGNRMRDYFGNLTDDTKKLNASSIAKDGTYGLRNLDTVDVNSRKISDDGVYEYKIDGNAYLSTIPAVPANGGNRTIVYNVSGNLIIDGNLNDERSQLKSNISELTGVVILANRVWITSKPDYINATIVANEVNTCKYEGNTAIALNKLNSDTCTKQLVFDAPVITKKIILNRTFGAGSGIASIQRAEIFNLNMGTYLWSFNQMQNYNQAVTTFTRELPSRY